MLPLTTILHPTDFSRCAEQALDVAVDLARHEGAALHLMHVVALPALSPPHVVDELYAAAHDQAEAHIQQLLEARDVEGLDVEYVVLPGPAATPPASVVVEYARELGTSLIVMGTHGRRAVGRLFLGSVAEEVMREAACPVLSVRAPEGEAEAPTWELQRILVPLDLSDFSRQVLPYAFELARAYDAELTFLYVLEAWPQPHPFWHDYKPAVDATPPDVIREFEDRAQNELLSLVRDAQRDGLQARHEVRQGYTASTILDYAGEHGTDLIVLTSQGRTGLARFVMGSVAEKVVRQAPCPVFRVKPVLQEAAVET